MQTTSRSYLLLSVIVLIFVAHTIFLNCLAEDAFISFRFAQNLAVGNGLTWNIGEPPVEGYTNFLWVIICAAILKLTTELPLVVQILGGLAGVATIFFTYMFARRRLNCRPFHALIPCLMLAVSGPFATWAGSGMETNFFTLFLLVGCFYFTKYWQSDAQRDLTFCFAALLVATLTRPEGLLVFVTLIGLSLVLSIDRMKQSLRDFRLPALIFLVPFLIYFFWRWSYFGYLLPNTFYAKTTWTAHQFVRGIAYAGSFSIFYLLPLLLLVAIFFWKVGRVGVIPPRNLRSIAQHARKHVGTYVCGIVSLLYTLYIIVVGGDYMAMYRFFVPILPLLLLLYGQIANHWFVSLGNLSAGRTLPKALVVFAVAVSILLSTPLETRTFPHIPITHGHYRGVQTERWHSARLTLLGKFFDEYKRSPDESLATPAIGAMSYYTDMKVYGMHGLVDPHIAHLEVTADVDVGFAGHEKWDFRHILSKRPTYIMLDRRFSPAPREHTDFIPEDAATIDRYYKHTAVRLTDTVNNDFGYFTFMELKEH